MKKNDETYLHIHIVSFLRKLQLAGIDFVFFHCPNGGGRSKSEGAMLKMMGVLPGVPDLCFLSEEGTFFVELKKIDGKPSKEQKRFFEWTRRYNVETYLVCPEDVRTAILVMADILDIKFHEKYHHLISQVSSSFLATLPDPI
jgi:hypothetical protein